LDALALPSGEAGRAALDPRYPHVYRGFHLSGFAEQIFGVDEQVPGRGLSD